MTAAWTGFIGPLNALNIHLIAGASIAALIGARLVWGMIGSPYARFSSFAFPPRIVLAHLRGLRNGHGRRHLGHNPIGSMMVFALLGVLTLIVLTGVVTLGGQDKQGPLRAFLTYAIGNQARGIHQLLALLLMAMVAAHLGGVLFESLHTHENLTQAMIDGRKRPEPGETRPGGQAHPRLATAIVLGCGAAIGAGVATLASLPAAGVPTAGLDPDFARECSACHIAYHPSLAPAATWAAILRDLPHHFGADASLDPAIATRISTYLAANAAEHWDTLAANRLRDGADPTNPLRITTTRFWRRAHHDIPDAVFATRPVGRQSNCGACHTDAATGSFSPQGIGIPSATPSS